MATITDSQKSFKYTPILEKTLNRGYRLVEGTDEIFELDLALWESQVLSEDELAKRSAYFQMVNSVETVHYKMCNLQNLEEIHKDSSFRTKAFFLGGKYSTGYATHGLFPYRGKFHPQLIRALVNVLGIKKGDMLLDPMGGSGTVAVEANLLGINAISVDRSPFCQLMTKVKTFSLKLNPDIMTSSLSGVGGLFRKFDKVKVPKYFLGEGDEMKPYYEVGLLAYLDAVGFSERNNSSPKALFPRVLNRYVKTIQHFQRARDELKLKVGETQALCASTLSLPLADDSVNAIITSPPYSFAINYLKNDQPQLEYLDADINTLQQDMIGLNRGSLENKLEQYFRAMDVALEEMRRVSKIGSPIVIIIGTNDIQTKGVQLEPKIIELAGKRQINLDFELKKPIRGMNNSMKQETILFFSNQKRTH